MQAPDGRKIYKTETKTLIPGKKFDEQAHGLYEVLKEYLDRGGKNQWTDTVSGINMITDDIHNHITLYNNLAMKCEYIIIKKTHINTPT